MMGKRKLPFGYRMELGEIVLHPQEAEVVRWIFQQYIKGASYTAIVQELQEQPVPYCEGKCWNKNMVARILEDGRYAGYGKDNWQIIGQEDLMRAQERRLSMQSPNQRTPAQKVIRQLSGQRATADIERQILYLLNDLISHPEQLESIDHQGNGLIAAERMCDKLNDDMWEEPIQDEKARKLIYEIAVAEYRGIGCNGFETERLKRLFAKVQLMHEVDADLLLSSTAIIRIDLDGTVQIQLKNGQLLGGARGTK